MARVSKSIEIESKLIVAQVWAVACTGEKWNLTANMYEDFGSE